MSIHSIRSLAENLHFLQRIEVPDAELIEVLREQIPPLKELVTRQMQGSDPAWNVTFAPTMLGISKVLTSQGLEGSVETQLDSMLARIMREPRGAFIADRGILSSEKHEAHPVAVCFEKYEKHLALFIADGAVWKPDPEYCFALKTKLEQKIPERISILSYNKSSQPYGVQTVVCSAFAIGLVDAFHHHPNFFEELLFSNRAQLDQMPHHSLLEHLPRDLELFTLEKAKALHVDHIKYLVLVANQEAQSSLLWMGSLIGRLSSLFTTQGVKKHD